MQNLEIQKETTDQGGRYYIDIEGQQAELTYTNLGENGIVIADHTGVPEAFRGRSVARALVDAMVADARENGFKIIPMCTYVQAQFRRHPEWSDVMV